MSSITESLRFDGVRAPRWLAIVLALLVSAFIASAVVRLGAEPAPARTRDPGPAITDPAAYRGDFHDGVVRRGVTGDQGFRGGPARRG